MLTLDLDPDIQLEYLAEGGANVVYRIRLPPPSPSTSADLHSQGDGAEQDAPLPSEIRPLQVDPRLMGRLVRLRKKNHPSVLNTYTSYRETIVPLFTKRGDPEAFDDDVDIPPLWVDLRDNLMEQILFKPTEALLKDCNAKLRTMEAQGNRPEKRHKTYLDENENHGCLVTDMTCSPDSGKTLVEFKPKWLVQSPTASEGARRCRTCALIALRRAERSWEPALLKGEFCPLGLVTGSSDDNWIAIRGMLGLGPYTTGSATDRATIEIQERLNIFLHKHPILERLRKLQKKLDPDGPYEAHLSSLKFIVAMTLRDCSLFLKVGWEKSNFE